MLQQQGRSVSRVDSAWKTGAIGNVMADGVGGGQSALQVSRPLSQIEATVLSLASSRRMPMLDKQYGRMGLQCVELLGSLEWAVQAEGCSMHPMVLLIPFPFYIQWCKVKDRCLC